MANDEATARLAFLREAAHLLNFSAPTVSAEIGAARNEIFEHRDAASKVPPKAWDVFRRETCGACGNLMIPGWSCTVLGRSRPKGTNIRKQQERKQPETAEKNVVYTCLRCDETTAQPVQKLERKALLPHRRADSHGKVDSNAPVETDKIVKTANASSKQRAKTRKGGLQAMLAQSKAQDSAKKGLDLMDFMQ